MCIRDRLAGLPDRAVVLFIGVKNIPLTVKAESLTEQPVCIQNVFFAERIEGFIAKAGQLLPVSQHGGKAELLKLGGVDVKKGDIIIKDFFGLPVLNRDQKDTAAKKGCELFLKGQVADGHYGFNERIVTVNFKGALIFLIQHHRGDLPYEPNHAKHMVCLLYTSHTWKN